MVRSVALLAVLIAARALPVDAVVLCAKPRADGTFSTSIKIREACRAGEMQLDAAALGLQGPTGTPGVRGPTGATGLAGSSLTVRDSGDTVVGIVTEAGDQPTIVRRIDGTLVRFYVAEGGMIQTGRPVLLYETGDCTGQAFLTSYSGAIMSGGWVHGATSWYGTSPSTIRALRSRLVPGPSEQTCVLEGGMFLPPDWCCKAYVSSEMVAPVATIDLNTFALTPPFHVEGP